MPAPEDRRLGLDRAITRRDFIGGFAVAVGGAIAAPAWLRALDVGSGGARGPSSYYPPGVGGLRGAHAGSFETAHALRDGKTWEPADTGERYDLVVVGAGLSGLAAAYFFRKANPGARVLILDNHDDFGGQCRRNELRYKGRLLIGYGGCDSIDTPSSFTPEGRALLAEVGVDLKRFYTAFHRDLYSKRGLQHGVFFNRETFGADRTVAGHPPGVLAQGPSNWRTYLEKTPLSAQARGDLERLNEGYTDYWAGLGKAEKIQRLKRVSYRDYLLQTVKVDPIVAAYYQCRPHDEAALGADAVSAWWCYARNYPGFQGLGLGDPPELRRGEPYIFHFPDGNAGLARLLVRKLIPRALPGKTMDDSVTARLDYGRLDEPSSRVRIRLESTAVRVRHVGEPGSDVEVTYVRGGPDPGRGERASRVTAAGCILACDNAVIPYLCPELPQRQREALKLAVRAPLVYTNVLLRDSRAFQKLGVSDIHCPSGFHSTIALDYPVSLGGYRFPCKPEEPVLLHLVRVPLKPGLQAREQFRAGRAELLSMTFEDFERETHAQLARALAGGGFDPARDIQGIVVNRWPHGYTAGQNHLFDPDWADDELPWVLARRRFGRIAIANADASGAPMTQTSIDQAYRAVDELFVRTFPFSDKI